MNYLETFGQNLRILRNSYKVSQAYLTILCGFKSTGTIAIWETARSGPTTEALFSISNLFGVSIDWLLGRTDKPYDDKILSGLESKFILESEYIRANVEDDFIDPKGRDMQLSLPTSYVIYKKRKKYYPNLETRANILFIYHKIYRRSLHTVLKDERYFNEEFPKSDAEMSMLYDYIWHDLDGSIDFKNLINIKVKDPIYPLILQ